MLVRARPTPSCTSCVARRRRARRPSPARFLAGGTAGGRGPRGYDPWQAPVGGVRALPEPLDAGAAACRAVHERAVAPHILGDPSSGALGTAAYGARRPVRIRRAGEDAELVLEELLQQLEAAAAGARVCGRYFALLPEVALEGLLEPALDGVGVWEAVEDQLARTGQRFG
ncbi:hypothetical protein DFH09DRAFT_1320765 [Mycena vulgaris]|nr:hypothetical protein DFH09DRAFT_1320765 [Mycena vulgaris]